MKKFKILIPVFNDWESLEKLLNEINIIIREYKNMEFSGLIIDDASVTEKNEFITYEKCKELLDCKKLNKTFKKSELV